LVFISKDPLSERKVKKLPQGAIIVDDNIDKLEDIYKRAKAMGIEIHPIVLNRREKGTTTRVSPGLSVINNLSELKAM